MTEGDGAAQTRPVAEASAIVKRFGATLALDDVSFAVRPGVSHALVGRNGAGKSTLVAILTGLVAPDRGEVRFDGEPAPAISRRGEWRERVGCVYQRSTIVPALTVAENLFLNRQPRGRGGAVDWRALNRRAGEELERWGLSIDPRVEAGRLPVEERQLVEITRALLLGTRLIILDEPTAELDGRATQELFARLRPLQDAGVAFVYISHHLDEIYEICQEVTVLRDGRRVADGPVTEMTKERVIAAMTEGVERSAAHGARGAAPAEDATPVLEIRGLGLKDVFADVSFTVRAGECVGLAGLAGSGKAEVGDAIAGLLRPDAGEVRVAGAPLKPGDVPGAIAAGVGYVPQDRRERGLVPDFSVEENMTMTVARDLGRRGLIAPERRTGRARELMERLDVKAASSAQRVTELSGGNQQKVVMGRALASAPKALVLINPTSGVDVASKESLFGTVRRAQDEGAAVVVVSDELDELRLCDRIQVIFEGRISSEHGAGWDDQTLVGAMEGGTR